MLIPEIFCREDCRLNFPKPVNPRPKNFAGILKIKSADDASALQETKRDLDAVIKKYKPDVVGVEKLYFAKNQKTAIAVAQAYTPLAGKFDGISLRVPVPAGSIADVTFIAKRPTTRDEVNDALRRAAKSPRWEGIFSVTDEELVSSDIVGELYASIADLGMTRVVDGTLVKVLAWYDNEMGYTESLVRHVLKAANA